jgi:murein DD-endopeptidase MepM/ murein hydrolase activator NlpD
VEHRPDGPYRAPFALARQFRVTQAYPSHITHVDAASAYAVDIEMPVGTQIYAARGGTVIEVASQYFEGSDDAKRAARANVVRILHADGTMALYAHLNWDSIRVRPGQVVERGEYIADSGNTGFSSGPHLHFAVIRNSGLHHESLPVQFVRPSGAAAAAVTGEMLAAH